MTRDQFNLITIEEGIKYKCLPCYELIGADG